MLLWCQSACVTVLICPLSALSRQHEQYLLSCGVAAAALSTDSTASARGAAYDALRRRALAVVIVSPEQIELNERLVAALEACGVGLVVYDEAHTWLSWSKWRPAMERAPALIRCDLRLALTATLRRSSERRLQTSLGMAGCRVARHPFFRSNLALRVEYRPALYSQRHGGAAPQAAREENGYRQRRAFEIAMDAVKHAGNAIIYVHQRRQADDLAAHLQFTYDARQDLHGTGAVFLPYHAGRADRRSVEVAFASRRSVVVVATVAFGMGINSPAVRAVIHMVRYSLLVCLSMILFARLLRFFPSFLLYSDSSHRPLQTLWICMPSKLDAVAATAECLSVCCFSMPLICFLCDVPLSGKLSRSTTRGLVPASCRRGCAAEMSLASRPLRLFMAACLVTMLTPCWPCLLQHPYFSLAVMCTRTAQYDEDVPGLPLLFLCRLMRRTCCFLCWSLCFRLVNFSLGAPWQRWLATNTFGRTERALPE